MGGNLEFKLIELKNYDVLFEWYFVDISLFYVVYFYCEIEGLVVVGCK